MASIAGFNSVNDYIYHLILREKERIAQQKQIESLSIEGLDSGKPSIKSPEPRFQTRSPLIETN